MELDAGDGAVLWVRSLIEKLARHCINWVHFWAGSRLFVSQLLEVILEYVYDLIWLQLTFNSWRHSINKVIKTLVQLGVLPDLFSSFAYEVLGIVSWARVNTTVIVCLSLQVNHFVGGLEADFELFALQLVHLSASFLESFKVISSFSRLFVDELAVAIVSKVLALHRHSVSDERSRSSRTLINKIDKSLPRQLHRGRNNLTWSFW